MPSFRTKRGRCHLTDAELRLESSLRGQLRRLHEGDRLLFASYLLALLVTVAVPVAALATGDRRTLLIGGGAAVLILVVARASNYLRGFTDDEEIPLDAITHVSAVEGMRGLTRPRFVVHYERDGSEKRRYVMMPSRWLSYGDEAFDRARAGCETWGSGSTRSAR